MRGYKIIEGWKTANLDDYSLIDFQYMVDDLVGIVIKLRAAQQGVHLTALRRGLAVSIFVNLILLVVVLFTIGGN
jgi:hypothetical protein